MVQGILAWRSLVAQHIGRPATEMCFPSAAASAIPTRRPARTRHPETGVPRYLIHIGPHKTGTTYLQRSFAQLRPALRARGIDYPDDWGGADGHHRLVEQLWANDLAAAQAAFDRLHRGEAATVLLSSETLAYLGDDDVARLHAMLRGQPATIIFYARRWSELLPSSWREMVKHGSLLTLPEFVLSCLGDPAASEVINFDRVLGRWGSVFGADVLRVASYSAVLDAGQDLLTHFASRFLDWPDMPETGVGRVNESLHMVDCEIIRSLNALEWTRARESRQRLYHRFLAQRDRLPVGFLVEQAMQYVVDTVRINDAAPGLAALHAAIADRYRPVLVPPLAPDGLLFAPRLGETLFIRPDYLMAKGVMETLRRMQTTLLEAR
jgi:hypothetical protein